MRRQVIMSVRSLSGRPAEETRPTGFPNLALTLGDEFAHFLYKFMRNCHYRFRRLYTGLVLDQGIMLGLFLVVRQNPAQSGIVPSIR